MFMNILQKKAFFIFRVLLGWLFLYAGLAKLFTPGWSAGGMLHAAKTFSGFYAWFATPGVLPVVNFLNAWGLTILGASLILGLFVRWSAIPGMALMVLYYFLDNAFPSVPNGFLVDQHVIFIFGLLLLFAFNAGKCWGLDELIGKKKAPSTDTNG